ncbi:MAG: hypothetical protein BWX80_03532 [Candidatus Hydrogenedentes bacterium ADurb.Bin101]|nr:MAG: hypothetical protein BWX80_03532 [Candidatus Hydrogenedentes bacterium ADurb.Bin101]
MAQQIKGILNHRRDRRTIGKQITNTIVIEIEEARTVGLKSVRNAVAIPVLIGFRDPAYIKQVRPAIPVKIFQCVRNAVAIEIFRNIRQSISVEILKTVRSTVPVEILKDVGFPVSVPVGRGTVISPERTSIIYRDGSPVEILPSGKQFDAPAPGGAIRRFTAIGK